MIPLIEKSKLVGTYKNAQGQKVVVYITQAYDEFKYLKANREVLEKTVKKIIASMSVKVEHAPLLCNEKGEIIDGQNRLEAYKRLNYPITFEIIEGLTSEDVRRLNTIQKEWKLMDHLHAGSVEDDITYKWLHNFCITHNIPVTTGLVLLAGPLVNYTPDVMDSIRQGTFTTTKEQRALANQRMAILEKFRIYSKSTTKNFTIAMCKVLNLSGLDLDRLVITFRNRYKLVLPNADMRYEGYMFHIGEMYNHQLSQEKRISFLSQAELERLNRKG